MSIKRITDPKEFKKVWEDLDVLFQEENKVFGHCAQPISAKCVIDSWAHPALLKNTMHTWASIEDEKANGIIMFLENYSTIFGKKVFMEFFWICKNPKKSFSLLRKALSFAKERGAEYVTINCVENHPKSKRLKEIYKKLGFNKDSETYIKKI